MNTLRPILKCLAAAGAALAVAQATAAPVTYIGYDSMDQAANGAIPVGSAFTTVRTQFEATLSSSGIQRETFGSSASAAATSLSVFGGTATITQSNLIVPRPPLPDLNLGLRGSVKNTPGGGRYNTTGYNAGNPSPTGAFWETDGVFSLNLNARYQAFGFDATDFADFDGTLTMTLFNGAAQVQVLSLGRPAGSVVTNGSVLFYGYTSDAEFDRVTFSIAQQNPTASTSYDQVGFDQFTVGRLSTAPTTVPEPGSLALVALALAGIGIAKRARAA